ncbi:hypothetical protein WR25_21065 [Diploscapter pachys]|uniref:Cyclin-like domain-containing protein n=1 Tax=Diploscapter pachys TaxID=2018661 RepID=A0A2A2KFI9_9BILA|nr:hypothetical protein WR25_21065 [Diploscapter pachys]
MTSVVSSICQKQNQSASSSDWLQCTETLSLSDDTPCTSSSAVAAILRGNQENAHIYGGQRKSASRRKRNSAGNTSVLQPRRNSFNSILNHPAHSSVKTLPDYNLHSDTRLLDNMMQREEHIRPNPHYFMSVQQELKPEHRQIAVKWILEIVEYEQCGSDVALLTVGLIDRFLSQQNIFQSDLQTLAGSCLLIASKLKQPSPLTARRLLAHLPDDEAASNMLVSWELLIVTQLNWELLSPTALDFFDLLCARASHLNVLRQTFSDAALALQKCKLYFITVISTQCSHKPLG